MKKVIFFYPRMGYYDTVVRNIPLSLLSVASNIKDYEVIIIDQRLNGWRKKMNDSLGGDVLAVGFSVMTGKQIEYALNVSETVKKEYPNIPVIWGGVHPSMLPKQTMENPNIDIVVEGEAENVIPDLLKNIEQSRHDILPGVWYKRGFDIIPPEIEGGVVDLDQVGKLPYGIIDFDDYIKHAEQNFGNIVALEMEGDVRLDARIVIIPQKREIWRNMSAVKIIEHIEHLKTFTDFDGLNFIDDDFFIDNKRLDELIVYLDNNKFVWGCEASVNALNRYDDAMLKHFEQSGLRWLSIGVETGSENILRKINKNLSIDEVAKLNSRLSGLEIYPMYNFMSGYIWETKKDLHDTTDLVLSILKDNKKSNIQTLNIVVPYPCTEYLKQCSEAGLAIPEKLVDWIDYNPDDWIEKPVWLNKKMKKTLKMLYVSSIFIDRKSSVSLSGTNILSILVKLFGIMFKPIAYLRFNMVSFMSGVEISIFDIFKKYLIGKRK